MARAKFIEYSPKQRDGLMGKVEFGEKIACVCSCACGHPNFIQTGSITGLSKDR
jgi:hypothetical protein